jgi:UDP-glucose 4-epimerase
MLGPRKCVVLGGLGFIGWHLIDALLAAGYAVRCFDRPNVVPVAEQRRPSPQFELLEGDMLSEADIKLALAGCDVCFHLISTTLPSSSNADPVFDVESNLVGTLRMLEHAVRAGIKKVIYVSSGGTVYGVPVKIPLSETHPADPICSYGIAKLAIEKYLALFQRLHGLEYVVLRISNPFGEYQRVEASQGAVAVFLYKALINETIEIWGDGSVVRDFIYISDVTRALLKAMDYDGEQRLFNIGSGEGRSLNDVLSAIEILINRSVPRMYKPARGFDVPANVLDINRAKQFLSWTPQISLEQGLSAFYKRISETHTVNKVQWDRLNHLDG